MKCTESKGNEYWHTCMIKEEMKCTESKGSMKSVAACFILPRSTGNSCCGAGTLQISIIIIINCTSVFF